MLLAVFIVTPAYNAERVISGAAAPIAVYDFEDWEWAVVDDGSRDGPAALFSELDDDRITLIRQGNRSVSAARTAPFEVPNGTYVTFLDAYDGLQQGSLSRHVAFLEKNSDIDILNGGIERFGETRDLTYSRQLDCIAEALGPKGHLIS